MKILKPLAYAGAAVSVSNALAVVFILVLNRSFDSPPPEQRVRAAFEEHKADYFQFVNLLRSNPSAWYIGGDGAIDLHRTTRSVIAEYQRLIHNIGAQSILAGEDGSVEFVLWGHGCAICSDSYVGVLFLPKGQEQVGEHWQRTPVASLLSSRLPQENGSVATGLYVKEIEAKWFVYRFEYRD